MSLTLPQALRSIALGQAMMVAPALGDSYEGKTAATIAALLLMLATDAETRTAREITTRDTLRALFESIDSKELKATLADGSTDALMAAFTTLHAQADANNPALAARCRAFLLDWAEGERLRPPALPG
jgi:hypothetical protein